MSKWVVDKAHSSLGFEVKHMMVSKVKGKFTAYTDEIEAADLTDLTTASIAFKIDVASVETNEEDRNNHLKSADFFDVATFPSMDFKSTKIDKVGDAYKVTGDLTIKNVTKSVTFDVEFGGKGKNPWGVEVYGFEAESKINREEFGLTWNAALETGGILVGKDVKIKLEFEINPAA